MVRLPHAFALALFSAAALSGCLTPHARPAPSAAVLQARAGAAAKPAACPVGDAAKASPMLVEFAFDDGAVTEVGATQIGAAAKWLACNPGVEVVVSPRADNHGTAAHQLELAQQRAQAVLGALRARGATGAVFHILAAGAPDPVAGPHLVIQAQGRGW